MLSLERQAALWLNDTGGQGPGTGDGTQGSQQAR